MDLFGIEIIPCGWIEIDKGYAISGGKCVMHPWKIRTMILRQKPPRFEPDEFAADGPMPGMFS